MIKLLKKIKHLIVYCRFGRNYRPDTPKAAKIFYNFMKFLHNKEFKERENFLENISEKIEENEGFKILNQTSIFNDNDSMQSLENLKNGYLKVDWDEKFGFKKKFLRNKQIQLSEDLEKVVLKLIPIVSNYLGSLAILQDALYWYSPNEENEEGRSQNWHMDAEDIKQVRVLIPIDDIDENSGPMVVLNALDTENVYNNLKLKNKIQYRSEKIPDFIVDQYGFKKNLINVKKNEVGFVDTCRCYHYGSRKAKLPRKTISLQFTSAFSIFTPMFNRNIKSNGFKHRKSQLIFCFLEENYHKLKNIKLKKWQIKIL